MFRSVHEIGFLDPAMEGSADGVRFSPYGMELPDAWTTDFLGKAPLVPFISASWEDIDDGKYLGLRLLGVVEGPASPGGLKTPVARDDDGGARRGASLFGVLQARLDDDAKPLLGIDLVLSIL